MASAGTDAIGEAELEAAAGSNKKKNRRRLSDYLVDSDDGAEEASPASPETPPQLRVPRSFTCARFRFGRLGRKRDSRKEDSAAKKKAEDSSAVSKPADQETSTSSSASAAEAGGMGLSMLLLLARTCVELNRMAEVRAEMEALLKELRDEAGRMKASARPHQHHHLHDVVVTPRTTTFNSNLQLSSSTTIIGSSSSCTTDTDANHHHHSHATSEETARHECESEQAEDEQQCIGGVVDLEETAEFEAEPAPHRPSPQWDTEQDESSDDEFIELNGDRHFVNGEIKWDAGDGDGGTSEDDESTCAQDGGAVSAAELERRLHELLHRRNRDRIAELESALRRAEQRLREKEMEARLWQDTATLAMQPPPPAGGQ